MAGLRENLGRSCSEWQGMETSRCHLSAHETSEKCPAKEGLPHGRRPVSTFWKEPQGYQVQRGTSCMSQVDLPRDTSLSVHRAAPRCRAAGSGALEVLSCSPKSPQCPHSPLAGSLWRGPELYEHSCWRPAWWGRAEALRGSLTKCLCLGEA